MDVRRKKGVSRLSRAEQIKISENQTTILQRNIWWTMEYLE